MSAAERLSLGFGRRLPMVPQTEAAECGLACLAMVSSYHGQHLELSELRRRLSVSLKGVNLAHLVAMAERIGFAARPLRLEIDELRQLALPCILHWDLNHFVVLTRVGRDGIVIHDPAIGVRRLRMKQVSRHFTGVALELSPIGGIESAAPAARVRMRSVIGRLTGIRRSLGQLLVLALAIEIFAILAPLFMQWVVDHALVHGDLDLLLVLALGFGLLLVLRTAVTAMRGWMTLALGAMMKIQSRANLFSHLVRLPTAYFESRHMGDIMSRFGSQEVILQALTTDLIEAVMDGLLSILTLAIMIVFAPMLTLVVCSGTLLYGLMRWIFYTPLRQASAEAIVWAARRDSHLLETMRGIRTLKLFNGHNLRRAYWLNLLVETINRQLATQKLRLAFQIGNMLLIGLLTILVVWLGARRVVANEMSVGMLLAFLAYKDQFLSRTTVLIDRAVDLGMLRLHAERLADIALTRPESEVGGQRSGSDVAGTASSGAAPAGMAPFASVRAGTAGSGAAWSSAAWSSSRGGGSAGSGARPMAVSVGVRGLCYRYSEVDPWVIDDLSFDVEAGETVAIVGGSGCGKTTLLKIMAGLLEANEGEVVVDGRPLSRIGVEAWRDRIGVVMQDDQLFAGSIADNVTFFSERPDLRRLEACLSVAALSDEIAAMPMGHHTLIGDMGTALSGGQKQRLLIARALYRRPSVLLLDEATSHLDIDNERRVSAAIRAMRCTRIIIAHRPETIRSADRVIDLEKARDARWAPAVPATARRRRGREKGRGGAASVG